MGEEIKEYDVLVLPGGRPGGQNLRENPEVISMIRYFNEHHKYLGAMCSGTIALETADVINGKKVTGYTGYENKLLSGNFVDEVAVFDQISLRAKDQPQLIPLLLKS